MNASKTYQWIVVGAGPHGVHFVSSLLAQGVPRSEVVLLDRHSRPLFLWENQTVRLQMGHLRSTAVHHLDISPWSLAHFAQKHYGHQKNWSTPPYRRPSYKVFQEHCEFVLAKYAIPELFFQCEVQGLQRMDSGALKLMTNRATLRGTNVVLCVGQPDPCVPSWSEGNPRVQHLLSPEWKKVGQRVAVVGGGMTACQFCLAHHKRFESTHLIAPKWPDVSNFDADPCWVGPKCQTKEFQNSTPQEKRSIIQEARRPGSVNPTVSEKLKAAVNSGTVSFLEGRVLAADGAKLWLDSGKSASFDHVLLGTGFEKIRPGGQFVDDLITQLNLPVGPCGYPLLSKYLEWSQGLYVTGGLAELSLGPVARNITGGRTASKLILENAASKSVDKKVMLVKSRRQRERFGITAKQAVTEDAKKHSD